MMSQIIIPSKISMVRCFSERKEWMIFFLMKYSFGIVFSGVVRIRDYGLWVMGYGLWVMGYGFAVICRSTRGKNIFLMILFYHKCNMQSRFINMSALNS